MYILSCAVYGNRQVGTGRETGKRPSDRADGYSEVAGGGRNERRQRETGAKVNVIQ